MKKIKKPEKKVTKVDELGERIKSLRIKKGYTNYENFAFDHGIPRSQFGRYENGENLKFLSLVKVIEALDMTLAEFFSEGFDSDVVNY